MKKIVEKLFLLVELLCLCVSCGDECDGNDCETITTSNPASGSVSINGTTISYDISGRKAKVGETLLVVLNKTTDAEARVIVRFDGEETLITEFPYYYKKELNVAGTYQLVIKSGYTAGNSNGSISVDSSIEHQIIVTN